MITLRKTIFSLVLILAFSLVSCQQSDLEQASKSGEDASQKIRVLTTIAPLYSFAKNVAGDAAIVENLLPLGADPHDYAVNPKDAMKAAEADLIVKNGVGLEKWLNRLISSAGERTGGFDGKMFIVDTSEGVEIINNDPHIWLSPGNAIIQVANIRDALIKVDVENSEVYEANAGDYIEHLKILDNEIRIGLQQLKQREFVSFHPAFLYFAKQYGLEQAAVIEKIPGMQPSPGHIAGVIKTIKARKIRSIFSEKGSARKIVKTLAEDLGLKVYELDTMEAGALSAQWYEERARENFSAFKEALK